MSPDNPSSEEDTRPIRRYRTVRRYVERSKTDAEMIAYGKTPCYREIREEVPVFFTPSERDLTNIAAAKARRERRAKRGW